MERVKALVFDVFGTLVDWRRSIAGEARLILAPLGVTLDWSPIGNITLQGGQGSVTYNMGKFAVSNDEVRVNKGSTMIMIGTWFQ